MEEQKKIVRLNIDLEEEIRQTLKKIALNRNIKLREYVLSVLNEAIELEEKYK